MTHKCLSMTATAVMRVLSSWWLRRDIRISGEATGADHTIRTKQDLTALDVPRESDHDAVVALLQSVRM